MSVNIDYSTVVRNLPQERTRTSSVAAALPLAHDLVVGNVEDGWGALKGFLVTVVRISSAKSFLLFFAAGATIAAELLAESA